MFRRILQVTAVRWPSRRVLGRVAWVLVVGTCTLHNTVVGVGLVPGADAQWVAGLNLAAHQHLQFGTDVVWTYGPLGYLGIPLYLFFGQWVATTAFTVAVHLGILGCVAVLLSRWRSPSWVWSLVRWPC